jgi:hypothetical protein
MIKTTRCPSTFIMSGKKVGEPLPPVRNGRFREEGVTALVLAVSLALAFELARPLLAVLAFGLPRALGTG